VNQIFSTLASKLSQVAALLGEVRACALPQSPRLRSFIASVQLFAAGLERLGTEPAGSAALQTAIAADLFAFLARLPREIVAQFAPCAASYRSLRAPIRNRAPVHSGALPRSSKMSGKTVSGQRLPHAGQYSRCRRKFRENACLTTAAVRGSTRFTSRH